jgi:cysteine desulfuration protein SufE
LRNITDIINDFAFLDDWEDRYRYVIELGKDLPNLSSEEMIDSNKVQGCVSQVWLVSEPEAGGNPKIHFRGNSDSVIVRGLVAIVLMLYSGMRAGEIVAIDAESVLKKLGLDEHLTPQRANGLRAVIGRIRQEAARLAA